MLVKERMKALGDHAKSSRQPPVKERKYAKADESAAKQDAIDEPILEDGATHESTVAVLADDVTPQIVVSESGDDGAAAEITSNEGAGKIAAAASVAGEAEPQPAAAEDSATQARTVQEDDDTSAAKRAIIHEWENWSALHSDELDDPNVGEYFLNHLRRRKPQLFSLPTQAERSEVIRKLVAKRTA
jgi:hypothetical protein